MQKMFDRRSPQWRKISARSDDYATRWIPAAVREDMTASPHGHLISMSDYYGDEGADTGGAGVSALRIADILRTAGVDLEVVAGFAYPRDRREEIDLTFLGGADLRTASKTSLFALAAGLWNETARHQVSSLLETRNPANTVIMLHQWTRYLSPAVLAKVSAFPHVIYVHDYFWACPTGTYYNYRTSEPCQLLPGGLRCMSTACDRVGVMQKGYRVVRHLLKEAAIGQSAERRIFIHVSDRSRHFLEPLYPNSTHATIYHPIGFVPEPAAVERAFDVAYFGRLEPEKGVIELAAAAKRTGKKCLFVGNGSEEEKLRERFPEATIMGWLPRNRVLETMCSCGAVVLPSLWRETWGSIVPEALSQSVPVLVSTQAGSSELVTQFGGGIVFDPSSPAEFDDAIIRVTADRASFSEAAGRAFVSAGLDEPAYVEKFVRLVQNTFDIELCNRPELRQAAVRIDAT
jgi:glycosyltransferase involved in cell wall biosynthesis